MSASSTQYGYLCLEDRVLSREIHFIKKKKKSQLPNIHGLDAALQSTEF